MTTPDVPGRAGFDSRTVRIFISSTFRDFAVERDLLVRKVFPELRRRCRERQVELVDVDLRWGITEAEAEQGKVLPICLAEIDRARPFFMGLLGERYGWVPAAGQFDRSLLIEQPWLEEHAGGKSVTELEILHGVLNNPQMAGRAFFYFRDPVWSVTQGADSTTGSEAERQKLADLKHRIRTSGFPVVEDYADPEALADRVREDLWTLIDAAYPETEVPDPLTLERRRHEAYAASRRRLYLGGEHYFEVLDAEMAAESPRPVLVRGRSGGGKSALLANWLARWSQAHPDTAVIVHHLGCGADAADPVRMAVRIMQEIALLVGEEFKPKSDPDEQLDDLATWLATASAWAERTGRAVLLVLDGLDKLADRRHLRWFPTVLPPGVRLVVSCLDGEVFEAASPRLPWRELAVEPFTAAEQTQFIGEYLGRFRKQLTPEQTRLLQTHPLVGNPLFLLTVLEELRVFGVHEELDERLATLLSPPPSKQPGEEPTVDDAFEHVLARIEADHGTEPVQRVMEAIWASRAGLYTDEILAIAEVPPATWAGIANALDESLYETSARMNFGHDYLRKAVEDRYGITGDTRLALHRRLAEYFNVFEPNGRIAEELPWQWREAQSRDELRECLTNLNMFSALYSRNQYELLGYWVWLGDDINEAYETVFVALAGDATLQSSVWSQMGNFLQLAGCYTAFVESLCREVLRKNESTFGSTHFDTLESVTALAEILRLRGSLHAAEPLFRRALEGRESLLGPEHPLTLASMNNLAVLLGDNLHDHDSAEALLRKVLQSYESFHGTDHHLTLMVAGNLANQLQSQGNYAAAEPLCRRVANGFEKSHGLEHPIALMSAYNLARLLIDQGQYEAVEPVCRQVVQVRERVLGVSHPDSLASLRMLVETLRLQGKLSDAEPLARRALERAEETLGPEHPIAIGCGEHLAMLLVEKGDHMAAEPLCRRVVECLEKTLGCDHIDSLRAVRLLAWLLKHQGRLAAAEPLYRRALEGFETILGFTHPQTLSIVNNLANVLDEQGDHIAAEHLHRRALEGQEEVLGPEHPDTLSSINNLAAVFCGRGDYVTGESLHRRALAGRQKCLGDRHPDTLLSFSNLAELLAHRGDYAGAEPLFRGAMEGYQAGLGPNHPRTEWLASAIAECVDALTPLPEPLSVSDPPGTVINSIGMKLVPIPEGEFLMGSPEDCPFGDPEEEFQHRVQITNPFLLGMHQVTQAHYERVTGGNPSFFKGPDLPVEHLTWSEAWRFCELLSDLPEERAAGRRYRLPTEAEWEYACRAGTATTFNTGDTLELHEARFATRGRSSPKPTAPVGSYPPNAWGLFDMHGNVWEWTSDWFSADYFHESPVVDPQGPATGTHHTLRGGSASVQAHECRSAIRGEASAVDGPENDTGNRYPLYGDFGIRVVAETAR